MATRQDAGQIDDEMDESLWTSPIKEQSYQTPRQRVPLRPAQSNARSGTDSNDVHETSLRQELENVRKVNEAIEGVIQSLEKAKSNMASVNQTVSSASSLLNIWTRILSQTEHSQRLILDPSWQGASQDIADIEEEATSQRQAAERREIEERERRAAAAKKTEEEENRRRADVAAMKPKPVVRGRSGIGRGSSTTRSTSAGAGNVNTSTVGSSRGTTGRRTTSGLTRGTRITRGRG